jgi:hypothetical protein
MGGNAGQIIDWSKSFRMAWVWRLLAFKERLKGVMGQNQRSVFIIAGTNTIEGAQTIFFGCQSSIEAVECYGRSKSSWPRCFLGSLASWNTGWAKEAEANSEVEGKKSRANEILKGIATISKANHWRVREQAALLSEIQYMKYQIRSIGNIIGSFFMKCRQAQSTECCMKFYLDKGILECFVKLKILQFICIPIHGPLKENP